MTVDDTNKARLALIAWRYRHLGLAPMIALMYAVRNRVTEDNWTPAFEEIERAQPAIPKTDSREPLFLDLLESVDWVYTGGKVDRWTGGGHLWAEVGSPRPAGATEMTAVIGGLEIWK